MRETDGVQRWSVIAQRGEPAKWPLVGKARERAERFEVADARKPGAHVTTMTAAPAFDGKHTERGPEDESIDQLHKPVVAGLEPFEIALKLGDSTRRRKAVAADR